MKIALIRQRYNAFGGAERFIERAVKSMQLDATLSLSLITRDWKESAGSLQLVSCNPPYWGRTWRDWSFARAACAVVAAADYDLVQSHERIACCDIFRAGDGVHAQWLLNRARGDSLAVRMMHSFSPWHRYTLAAERRLFTSPRLRAVICNSRMVAEEIRRHFGTSADKLEVIYNGVDLEAFHPRLRSIERTRIRSMMGISDSALLLLLVGSGFARKGVSNLLRAFAAMPKPRRERTYVVVVGADRKAGAMQQEACRLGISERVRFPGPQRDVAAWYAASDCLVLPTIYDPFPNVVLEAMACGLPVVTSKQCGAAELLQANRTGWVFDAYDIPGLSACLAALEPRTLRLMGDQARQLAESYPLARTAREMAELYRRLLSSGATDMPAG